jgi:U3 small nucleolar RNA-associated protein 23
MKQKKYKRCQMTMMNVYGKGFGMRPPYHFIADDTFCVAALRHKFDIRSRLAFLFEAPVRVFTTSCVMGALKRNASESEDPTITGAPFVGRRLELRRCTQHTPGTDPSECILDILRASKQPFGIATAATSPHDNLKARARLIEGTPVVYVERTFPLLEAPSEVTMAALKTKRTQGLKLDAVEAAIIRKRLLPASDPSTAAASASKHKRRRVKGPNPLSVKKPKAPKQSHTGIIVPDPAPCPEAPKKTPRKRRRRRST